MICNGYVFQHNDLYQPTCPLHGWLGTASTSKTIAFARLQSHQEGLTK